MALLDAGRYGNESISCSARINVISSDIEIHITKDVEVLSLLALLVQKVQILTLQRLLQKETEYAFVLTVRNPGKGSGAVPMLGLQGKSQFYLLYWY